MTTVFLYPQTEAKRPANNRERLKPIEREVKSPPTSPWERERLSSIKGRMGEKAVRVEKFRYQRHQKMKRGRSLIISLASNHGGDLPGGVEPSHFFSSSI